jgi:hypothetical protein
VLGFSPAGLKEDGSFHSLKIRVPNEEGVRVEARGYYALKHDAAEEAARPDIDGALFWQEEMSGIPVGLRTAVFQVRRGLCEVDGDGDCGSEVPAFPESRWPKPRRADAGRGIIGARRMRQNDVGVQWRGDNSVISRGGRALGAARDWAGHGPTSLGSGDSLGPNDKPVGGGANEVERITGHQGKDLVSIRVQHRDVRWTHYPG